MLVGGYFTHNINDTCAITIAEETAALLSTIGSFVSNHNSSPSECVTHLEELQGAESQVNVLCYEHRAQFNE